MNYEEPIEAMRFADWAAYNYTKLGDGKWRRRGGGFDKKTIKAITTHTTKQLYAIWKEKECK